MAETDPEGDDQQRVTIIAYEEPEPTSILTEEYDSWSPARKTCLQLFVVALLVYLTWDLAFRGRNLGANLAAAATTTVASVLIPDMVIFASIGAYGGMTNLPRAVDVISVAILTAVSAVCFEYFKLFAGKGGRLGSSAFVGSALALLFLYAVSAIKITHFYDSATASYDDIDVLMALNILVCNVLGAILTYYCRWSRPFLSPVVAGNAVALLLIIVLESSLFSALTEEIRVEAAGSLLQGAFVGMTSLTFLPRPAAFVLTGLMSGCVTMLCYPLFPHGVGGKRGTMAFIAVNAFVLLTVLRNAITEKLAKPPLAGAADKPETGSVDGVALATITRS